MIRAPRSGARRRGWRSRSASDSAHARAGVAAPLPGCTYPWWAATSRNGSSDAAGTRFDVIILVGRVEMWGHWDDCNRGLVSATRGGYAPLVGLQSCGTGAGAPALVSDHKPIGARLRIYAR